MLRTFQIHLSWSELIKRTAGQISKDDVLGLAAQLSFYLLLALVPAILFLVALTGFFPGMVERLIASLSGVAPPAMVELLEEQLRAISAGEPTGLMTFGFLMALWSSSAALVSVIYAMNRVYDIEESRPWWKVRLTAILLTMVLAVLVIVSFGLVVAGPAIAEWLAAHFGFGPVFEWTWKILQWPVVFALVTLGIGLVNYFAPDAEQDWEWITPGSLLATVLWLVASLAFRVYVTSFGDFNETYGTLGGVIMLMLWFYISSLAVLVGAEMNAEIEHASPHGKDPGEKVPGERKKIGAVAAREYEKRQSDRKPQPDAERPVPAARPAGAVRPEMGPYPPRPLEPQPSMLRSLVTSISVLLTVWWFRRRARS